jgi:hypothetical protein
MGIAFPTPRRNFRVAIINIALQIQKLFLALSLLTLNHFFHNSLEPLVMLLRHIPRILDNLSQNPATFFLTSISHSDVNFSSISAEEKESVWVEDISGVGRREEVSESPTTEPENPGNTEGRLGPTTEPPLEEDRTGETPGASSSLAFLKPPETPSKPSGSTPFLSICTTLTPKGPVPVSSFSGTTSFVSS